MNSFKTTLGIASLLIAGAAMAEPYPSKPVTLVVAFPPGGASDAIGRLVAEGLTKQTGQMVIVENRAGFGGNVGAKFVSKAPSDGYTLLMCAISAASVSQTLTPSQAGYRLEKDFVAISMLGKSPMSLVVNSTVPVNSLGDFIRLAKEKPKQLTYSSAGSGTMQHMAAELFQLMTGTQLVHVPYKGSGPSMVDLLGGQVYSTFENGPAIAPFIKSGKLKVLAYANESRSTLTPDVPTADESGLPGFNVSALYGLLAPAGTPQPIIEKLNAEVKTLLEQQSMRAALAQQGVESTYSTPADAAKQIKNEVARWAKVIKDAQITAD